jgi:hypothetical protein
MNKMGVLMMEHLLVQELPPSQCVLKDGMPELFLRYFIDVPALTNTISPYPEQGLGRQHSCPHMGPEPHT